MGGGSFYLQSPFNRRPKATEQVTKSTETSSNFGAGNIPQAALGMPVAAVLGRKRVPDANTIWTGNLRPLTQTTTSTTSDEEVVDGETVTTTTTTTTTAVIGYLVDIHMGICLGPDVHLLAIYVDNQRIWQGDAGPDRTVINIGKNETFLSNAECVFSGGAYDQAPEPDVDVPDYPGYVGVATILMKNVRVDLPMGNLSFEVYRTPNPLSLDTGDNLDGHDLNLMSAAVEVMTNPWGWGGLDISHVDTVTLSAIAGILASEGNFCSVKVGSDVSVAAMLKAFQDQASMFFFQDPQTGLVTGKLFRADEVDYTSLVRRLNTGNILSVSDIQKNWWPDTVEQARGLYTERDNDYNDVPIFVQNAANISQSGRGRRTLTVQYPYVTSEELTLDLVSRDLGRASAPTINLTVVTNRDGADLVPGDIVTVTHPDYSLLNFWCVVTKVRKQPRNQNNVSVSLSQATFPDTTPLFGAGGSGYDPGFNTTPQTPTAARVITAPYFFARSAFGLTSNQVSARVYPVLLPVPANNVQFSFGSLVENMPGASGDTSMVTSALYPTYARLQGSIDHYDGYTTGEIASVTVGDVVNPTNLTQNIGEDGVRDGRLFLLVGDEIMSFESVTNNGDGTFTLNNVWRALLDTVPQDHANDSEVFVVNNNFNYVGGGFSYPLGFTPDWVFTSNSLTARGLKEDGLEYSGWAPSAVRSLAPPAPHDTKVDGTRSETPVEITEGDSVTVTWRTRSRINQKVRLQTDAADTAESGQVHRVFHRSSGGTVTEIGTTTYSGNSASFTMPNVADGLGSIYVQAEILHGASTYTSVYQDRVPVNVSPP